MLHKTGGTTLYRCNGLFMLLLGYLFVVYTYKTPMSLQIKGSFLLKPHEQNNFNETEIIEKFYIKIDDTNVGDDEENGEDDEDGEDEEDVEIIEELHFYGGGTCENSSLFSLSVYYEMVNGSIRLLSLQPTIKLDSSINYTTKYISFEKKMNVDIIINQSNHECISNITMDNITKTQNKKDYSLSFVFNYIQFNPETEKIDIEYEETSENDILSTEITENDILYAETTEIDIQYEEMQDPRIQYCGIQDCSTQDDGPQGGDIHNPGPLDDSTQDVGPKDERLQNSSPQDDSAQSTVAQDVSTDSTVKQDVATEGDKKDFDDKDVVNTTNSLNNNTIGENTFLNSLLISTTIATVLLVLIIIFAIKKYKRRKSREIVNINDTLLTPKMLKLDI